jgi:hypothetical protein
MRIAYLIFAHNNLKHLGRLIDALNGDEVSFFIHIDKKVVINDFFKEYDNVTVLKNRISVNWGGYSFVEAILLGLKSAYQAGAFDYYVLLSGVDYPIRSNQYIQSFFSEHKGKSFINIVKMPGNGKSLDRLYYYHIEGDWRQKNTIKMLSIRIINSLIMGVRIKRKLPPRYADYIMYGGSSWWALHRDFVAYLMKFYDTNPVFFNFYKHTFCPDEMIFQTIIMNSPYRQSVANGLTYHDWSLGEPPYPALIGELHLPILKQKVIDDSYGFSEHLFARKFSDKNDTILAEIEKIRSIY